MNYKLRMTQSQHETLRSHLFPGDNLEAVAILLCGRRKGTDRHVFTVRKVVVIPHNICDRHVDHITWPTDLVDDLIKEAYGKEMAIVKIHSHPEHYRKFSRSDDISDERLFSAISSLLDDNLNHASLIMLPDGEIIGRVLDENGLFLSQISSIMAVGDDISIWNNNTDSAVPSLAVRHAQAFGKGTTDLLRGLSIAIVGCSGTGSIVIEQLARLGVGRFLLVDSDLVEDKNLNRILNSGKEDAYLRRPKVNVLASSIARMGLGQEVVPLQKNLIDAETLKAVAECDAVFGCMDGVEGRHWLNRLATFYTIPYFDVGVRFDADGSGGINQISGSVHYLQPGKSSLLSREVYRIERVEAEEMARTNPEMYALRVKEGYLRGVEEDRPAVVSVNMLFAALVVNEFLARLHPSRNQPNGEFAYVGGNLSEVQLFPEGESTPCPILERHVGRGDMTPLLDRPFA